MRQISNPNAKTALIFGVLGALGVVTGIVGFMMEDDTMGLAIGIIGLVVAVTFAITVPILVVTGRKQIQEIEELIAGQDLRAYWTFDPDEWSRHTENEHARGMKQTRSTAMWTFIIAFVVIVAIELFAGALSAVTIIIALAIAVGLTALLGGTMYLSTKSAYATNRAGVGEVFIGGTSIYFGTRFYTWKGKWANLKKVIFEEGNPCVVQVDYEVGGGDNTSYIEVRIPVPRGREQEAQELVNSYYAAS
ncbi:MAG TPA: hypothetical protein VD969_15675 [Symbiobacteriaceae bacterium]|nr:hypothetical protein [Symbiobacteriaceae bacterium]